MRFLLPLLTAALLFSSCKKEKQALPPEVAEEKLATFHVFAARDYTGTPEESTTAEVRLQLRVINYRTGEQTLVWDSTLARRRVVDFPLYNNRLEIVKKHPVLNSYQKLNAGLSVVFRNGQMISQEGRSKEATPGIASVLLEAGL